MNDVSQILPNKTQTSYGRDKFPEAWDPDALIGLESNWPQATKNWNVSWAGKEPVHKPLRMEGTIALGFLRPWFKV